MVATENFPVRGNEVITYLQLDILLNLRRFVTTRKCIYNYCHPSVCNTHFWYTGIVRLQNLQVKFVYQGHCSIRSTSPEQKCIRGWFAFNRKAVLFYAY